MLKATESVGVDKELDRVRTHQEEVVPPHGEAQGVVDPKTAESDKG